MDAEQLSAVVRARCRRSLCRVSTAGRAPVLADLTDLAVARRRLVLLPDGCPPVPRAAPDAGEEVRYLPRAGAKDAEDTVDFVLVDDRWAVRLLHDDHGRFATAVQVPAGSVGRYRWRWDLAWATARSDQLASDRLASDRLTPSPAAPRER